MIVRKSSPMKKKMKSMWTLISNTSLTAEANKKERSNSRQTLKQKARVTSNNRRALRKMRMMTMMRKKFREHTTQRNMRTFQSAAR